LHAGVRQPLYSTEVQQRPRTVASMHCHQRLIQPVPDSHGRSPYGPKRTWPGQPQVKRARRLPCDHL